MKRHLIPQERWLQLQRKIGLLRHLTEEERMRMRDLVSLFQYKKAFSGAAGFQITDELRETIAVFAALPILNLGLVYYQPWVEIIVYPGAFNIRHEYLSEDGVVHTQRAAISGEAWLRGPVVLSANDIEGSVNSYDGFNVVIHEMAHKIDMLNGDANGFPPLHREMNPRRWAEVFNRAYEHFCIEVENGVNTIIDPYAAEDPAEFFAVMTEIFFEVPAVLIQHYSDVYDQLKLFYRQDPVSRAH